MPIRRRQAGGLHRVLGTPALFSTAYGNVGSSIYYALGLVTVYALGLTPIAFFISGLIFFFTAVTYAEATARFPEAGGSSSFTRHAFNEAVSFFAGWAQMLNYTVTIAISAVFVPHYLDKFWPGHLITHPGDIIGGALVIGCLAALNIVGVKEAAGLNIFLALADLATQALLVLIGLVVVFSPHVLTSNVDLGVTPTWANFVVAIPVAMVAYTGIETVSNMAEEAIDPPRHVPRAIMYVVLAVFAIYAFLPSVALSAMPVQPATRAEVADVHKYSCVLPGGGTLHVGDKTSQLACHYANDPVAGLVATLPHIPSIVRDGMAYYVALLAATILIIATNAGIIGVSRLTYSMGHHRQLPEALRRVHPRFSTPYVAIGLFSVLAVLMTFGNSTFLGNLYAFGAMLSFTLAHASVLWMRRKLGSDELPWRGPLSFRVGSYDLPLFAALGGIGTLISWFVTIALHFHDNVAPVGFAWLGVGMVVYVVYRRSQGLPLKRTVVAPAATLGPAIEVEYRSILMPLTAHRVTDEMTATALRLAAETGTRLIALYPVEVPLDRPLSDPMAAEVAKAERELREAAALGREYGVSVVTRIVRTRNVGEAIVEEAARRHAEIIVMGAASRRRGGERMFGRVVDYVLRNAPCRVMVGTPQVGAV